MIGGVLFWLFLVKKSVYWYIKDSIFISIMEVRGGDGLDEE